MNIIVDESVSFGVVRYLRAAGYDYWNYGKSNFRIRG